MSWPVSHFFSWKLWYSIWLNKLFCKSFIRVSWEFRESFARVSREFRESFARVSQEFCKSFVRISQEFQVIFREFLESFARVSLKFRESFAKVSREFRESFSRVSQEFCNLTVCNDSGSLRSKKNWNWKVLLHWNSRYLLVDQGWWWHCNQHWVLCDFCKSFARVSQEFCESFARVLQEFHESFARVLWVFRESFARVLRGFYESSNWFREICETLVKL